MKEKTYSVKLFDRKDGVNRYCITWKNKRAETALLVPANMPNHINFLEELLIDENYVMVEFVPSNNSRAF
jgi:hypothetical protein